MKNILPVGMMPLLALGTSIASAQEWQVRRKQLYDFAPLLFKC